MPTYVYPTSAQLTATDPVHVANMAFDDPIFRQFPITPSNAAELFWDQRDDYKGLMQFRGYDGEPKLVQRVGGKRYRATPGVFGEKTLVNEEEMTRRAAYGTWASVVNVTDLVEESRMQLLHRQINRMSWTLWTLAAQGEYVITDESGGIVDFGGYSPQIYSASVAWSNHGSATPMADLRAIKLLGRGKGTQFNSNAVAMMNQGTANHLFANTNANDLAGKRTTGLQSVTGLVQTNQIFRDEDLPQLVVHDGGYIDDAGTFQTFIPDDIVVVFGVRPNGARLGEYRYTINRVNPSGLAQPYARTVAVGMADNEAPPPRIEVHRGFNGGPVVYFPGSIVVMKV